jgi:hypothetical protein
MIPGVGSIGLASVEKCGCGSVVIKSSSSDGMDATSGTNDLARWSSGVALRGGFPQTTHHGDFITENHTALRLCEVV